VLRSARWLVALACVVTVLTGAVPADATGGARDVGPFRGLGTWVDVYDYVPGFQSDGGPPPVTVDSIDDMASLGVRTLYLQAAQDDTRIAGPTVDPALLGPFLRRAHAAGMDVVAWYVAKFDDVPGDLQRIRGLARFRSHGERFDGIALDVEYTQGVPDPVARNAALLEEARQTRRVVGSRPLGAVVLEPLLIDQVNPRFWPDFPWKKLGPSFDVWMPMTYWTNRDSNSGLRDGYLYTSKNIQMLRKHLGDANAAVHVVGGIADTAATKDYVGFVKAAHRRDAVGYSVYDFNTTTSGVWAILRAR
jgi:hypothetical protein